MFQSQQRLLHFLDAADVGGYFWINALEWNGCYRLNMSLGTAEFVGIFEHADVSADRMFFRILECQRKIFFIPWFFEYLVCLDTETLETKYWRLPESITAEIGKFRAAYLFENKIYMFPMYGEEICIFDINTEQFECENIWIKMSDKCNKGKGDFVQGCQVGSRVYLPSLCRNSIFEYELYEHKYKWLPVTEKPLVSIVKFTENELLLLSKEGNVWKYNFVNGQSKLVYRYKGKFKEYPYSNIFCYNRSLYLIPAQEENISKVEDEKEVIMPYPVGWEMRHSCVGIDWTFSSCYKDTTKVMLYPCLGNMILELGKKGSWKGKVFYDDILKWEKEAGKRESFLNEYKMNIKTFLGIMIHGQEKEIEKDFHNNGSRIWYEVMQGRSV